MLLLKFVKVDDQDRERPVGALSWYAIHPTDRGQKNTLVCGDNKGHASSLFEQEMDSDRRKRETFVAAFANAHCGDVSGNVKLPNGVDDIAHMRKHGRLQFELAERLFRDATEEVSGRVEHRHTRIDFSKVSTGARGARTWPAALGLSFAAGSAVDSVPKPDLGIDEGRTAANLSEGDAIIAEAAHLALSAVFGIDPIDQEAIAEREGRLPKPVVLMPGIEQRPVVPQVLPVQLLPCRRRRRARDSGGVDHDGRSPPAHQRPRRDVRHERHTPRAGHLRQRVRAVHHDTRGVLRAALRRCIDALRPPTLEAHQQVAAQLATAIAEGKPSPPGPARPSGRPLDSVDTASGTCRARRSGCASTTNTIGCGGSPSPGPTRRLRRVPKARSRARVHIGACCPRSNGSPSGCPPSKRSPSKVGSTSNARCPPGSLMISATDDFCRRVQPAAAVVETPDERR